MNNPGKNDTAMESREKQRPTKPGPQALPAGLIHNLEELRSSILRRLESIEALARRCSGVPSVEITRTEQMLRQRIDELELERSRSLSDLASEDPSDKRLLTQLENDRKLLAEAWERLDANGSTRSRRGPSPGRHCRLIIRTRPRGSPCMVCLRSDSRPPPRPPTPLRNPFSVSFKRSVATSAARRTPAVPRTEKVPHHARGSFTAPGTPQPAGRLPP